MSTEPDPSTEPTWRKSSYSGGQGGNCVEVATRATASEVMVRDSTDTAGPVLSFSREAWRGFMGGMRNEP
jgi:hypothetical protein